MEIHIPADFTLAELRAFIEGESRQAPEGFLTAQEWAAHFKVSVRLMRQMLSKAKAKGLLDMSRVEREALDGKTYSTPVYGLRKPEDE